MSVCAFTANRDPEAFAGPDDFDITVERDKARTLTFGAGIHFCVGRNLARAEIAEALRFLAERIEIARAGRRGRAAERERDLRRRDVAGRVHGRLTAPAAHGLP